MYIYVKYKDISSKNLTLLVIETKFHGLPLQAVDVGELTSRVHA